MLIDTHCHLTDERLSGDLGAILSSLNDDGLERLITVGYDRKSSEEGCAIAKNNDAVYAAVGIHPHDSKTADADFYDYAADAAASRKVAAIGEIGLDYHYDLSPRDVQRRVFAEQLELASMVGLPVVVHIREAYDDARKILFDNRAYLENGLVLHCYSGSPEMVSVFGELDAYFSFGGAITFKNARRNIESLSAVPKERLLLETDSPYMTPTPFRGKTNYPAYIGLVAEKAAEILGTTKADVTEQTTENAKRLFRRLK